jgi:glycine cleavage system H protein
MSGTVVEVNTVLADQPARVNEDPYGDGWMIVLEPTDPSAYDGLWEAGEYRRFTEKESGGAG